MTENMVVAILSQIGWAFREQGKMPLAHSYLFVFCSFPFRITYIVSKHIDDAQDTGYPIGIAGGITIQSLG